MVKVLPFALAAVPFLFNTGLQVSGISSTPTTVLCWSLVAIILVWATVHTVREWHVGQLQAGLAGVQAWHFLVLATAGTWLFMTIALGTAGWLIWTGQAVATNPQKPEDEGPLTWIYNFSMEGGISGLNVFSLRFRGANTSKKAIQLKEANIISLIDGTSIPLEIVAADSAGEPKIVEIEKVQLIAPGAPIELVAKFNLPTGMEPKSFLEKWRKFSFNVTDNTRSYHFDFNENAMMPFFQGKVGPRVVMKPDDNK